jgi:ATP-dependent RNA helicase DDX31/DBP7
MADDGMLLNFELGDAPLKSQVKFKGGRWRDRVRAQKSVKKWQQKSTASDPQTTTVDSHEDDSNHPSKRRKVGDGDFAKTSAASSAEPSKQPIQKAVSHGGKPGHVKSRLFTSNPTPVTVFDDRPVQEAEPTEPSNAPLSEEAENFLALGLSRRVAQHLAAKLEMRAPTAIQKNTIPRLVKEDSDAFLQAETGSGKTLAYLLPIIHRIMALSQDEEGRSTGKKVHRNSGLFAIILAPTRELCKQIAAVLEKVLRCAPWLVSTTVIGGESKKSEKARIRKGVNILIATPGRLTDHLDNTKVLNVGTVRWLVLDEGDRMMEMGFEEDLRTIVRKIRQDKLERENHEGLVLDGVLPSRRVTVLCSATMKMDVQKLGDISLEDAVHITASKPDADKDDRDQINESVFAAPSQLKQSYIIVPAKLRLVTLVALLKSMFARRGSIMKAIIFISCADSVDFHFELLKLSTELTSPATEKAKTATHTESTVAPASYITSPANPTVILHKLHGSLAQPVRTATLQAFSACKDPAVLVTTDISSRGLDVPEVDLVVEYDPAFAVADHVHRIGRTARAGRPGKAVLFLQPGCEEGYVSILHSSSAIAPQLYETVLQKGLASPVNLPLSSSTDATADDEKQSWTTRAESLQLHFEQRLLARPEGEDANANARDSPHGKGQQHKRHARPPRDSALLDSARQAFRSHVRAYATHVREERGFFDMTQLHLGHMAKSFGLREAPGGIGSGIAKRTAHKQQHQQSAGSGKKRSFGNDDDGGGGGAGDGVGVDDEAARRMREKMRAVMNASSEFNIG